MKISKRSGPKAIGPYSDGMSFENLIFVSGQLPIDPETGKLSEDIETQTRMCMKNIELVLNAANSDLSQILKTTIYIRHMEDFSKINSVYKEYFKNCDPPARVCVEVSALPKNANIEIDAIGYIAKRS